MQHYIRCTLPPTALQATRRHICNISLTCTRPLCTLHTLTLVLVLLFRRQGVDSSLRGALGKAEFLCLPLKTMRAGVQISELHLCVHHCARQRNRACTNTKRRGYSCKTQRVRPQGPPDRRHPCQREHCRRQAEQQTPRSPWAALLFTTSFRCSWQRSGRKEKRGSGRKISTHNSRQMGCEWSNTNLYEKLSKRKLCRSFSLDFTPRNSYCILLSV